MRRRSFLQMSAAAPLPAADAPDIPKYRVVSRYQPQKGQGMPGSYPGQVVSVHAEKSIDPATPGMPLPFWIS